MINYLALLLPVLLVWCGVFIVAPRMLRSISRHKFWRLRDNLYDAIHDGEIVSSKASRELLARIECAIKAACDLTLLQLIFATPSIWTPHHISGEDMPSIKDLIAELPEEDAKKLQVYYDRFTSCVMFHVLLTSPLGWFATIALFITFLIISLVTVTAWSHTKAWEGLYRLINIRTNAMLDYHENSKHASLLNYV